jgi:spermidine synthase
MKLKSFFKKIFTLGEVLEKTDSPINGEIKVVDDLFGDRSMIIGGVSQSGYLVTKLWNIAIKKIQNSKLKVKNCLILGLGCGNAAKIVADKFPGCEIVGIEIDPKVVEIGKKYFGLDEIKNLKIIVADAFKYVENSNHKAPTTNRQSPVTKYDLILVDLYLGQQYPKEAESEEFIKGIKEILNNDGIVIFNRLFFGKYNQPAGNFSDKMKLHFYRVFTKKAITNLLIFASN